MFERYTEKARRTIFFARYEASQYGSDFIEVLHLLLGLMRESFPTIQLVSGIDPETLRRAIEPLGKPTGKALSTSVDLPLNHACRRVLTYAAEEAEGMGHQHIGPEHLLLGILREDGAEAQTLRGLGIQVEAVRQAFGGSAGGSSRYAVERLLARVPEERMEAAARILAGLASEYFRVTGESAEGPFTFSFGKAAPL